MSSVGLQPPQFVDVLGEFLRFDLGSGRPSSLFTSVSLVQGTNNEWDVGRSIIHGTGVHGELGVVWAAWRGLDVRLGCAARRIDHGHAVTVHHDRGAVTADRAIIAIPPHLIAAIDFTPRLPPERAALVAQTPMGAVIKCTAIYDRPFWRDAGLSGLSLSDRGPIHVAFDNSPPDGSCGVLMGFAEADAARRLGALDEEIGRAHV